MKIHLQPPLSWAEIDARFYYDGVNLRWRTKVNNATVIGSIAGSYDRRTNSRRVGIEYEYYPVANLIWYLVHKVWVPKIYRLNDNYLDDRVENMSPEPPENLGLFWVEDRQKWHVRLYANSQVYFVGDFRDKTVAQVAVRKKHNEIYGISKCL